MPLSFKIDPSYVAEFKTRPSPLSGLGSFVAERTYYRPGEDWVDVCERVVNGMYSLQKEHGPAQWYDEKAQRGAKEAFSLLYDMKWSPPGRGLWTMGTDFVHERGHAEALQNCAFISSKWIHQERGGFFSWIMEHLMFGVGVGFDVMGSGRVDVVAPDPLRIHMYRIPDSREGWAESVKLLVDSYLPYGPFSHASVEFDYSLVRPEGMPIKGFGGVASGPAPLKKLHDQIRLVLTLNHGYALSSRSLADIGNMIGECVIAGNVRRSAEIILGPGRDEFLNLKDPEVLKNDRPWGWSSNNSVVFEHPNQYDYDKIAERTYENGEPGIIWLNNAREFGRMNSTPMEGDEEADGVNPCAEQILHHREMCTLTETYYPRIVDKEEYARVVKVAYLYAKSVTLASNLIGDEKSRAVMTKNRRIGLSASGLAMFQEQRGRAEMIRWMHHGYELSEMWDGYYSKWLNVPKSVRHTSVKPSGTVSLLANVTPGVHYPVSNRYIRRVRIAEDSPLVERVQAAGYHVEPDAVSNKTAVVSFPVNLGNVRSVKDVPLMEQIQLAVDAGEHYADNAVSFTGNFRKEDTPDKLATAFRWASTRMKTISLLPLQEEGEENTFVQMPYEPITEGEYLKMTENIGGLDVGGVWRAEDHVDELYCEGDTCTVQ